MVREINIVLIAGLIILTFSTNTTEGSGFRFLTLTQQNSGLTNREERLVFVAVGITRWSHMQTTRKGPAVIFIPRISPFSRSGSKQLTSGWKKLRGVEEYCLCWRKLSEVTPPLHFEVHRLAHPQFCSRPHDRYGTVSRLLKTPNGLRSCRANSYGKRWIRLLTSNSSRYRSLPFLELVLSWPS